MIIANQKNNANICGFYVVVFRLLYKLIIRSFAKYCQGGYLLCFEWRLIQFSLYFDLGWKILSIEKEESMSRLKKRAQGLVFRARGVN